MAFTTLSFHFGGMAHSTHEDVEWPTKSLGETRHQDSTSPTVADVEREVSPLFEPLAPAPQPSPPSTSHCIHKNRTDLANNANAQAASTVIGKTVSLNESGNGNVKVANVAARPSSAKRARRTPDTSTFESSSPRSRASTPKVQTNYSMFESSPSSDGSPPPKKSKPRARAEISHTNKRHFYRDPDGIKREIWMPGDGDGDPKADVKGKRTDTSWRFFQSPIGTISKNTQPPKYVVLDDQAVWEIAQSDFYKKSTRGEYWSHDFNRTAGMLRYDRRSRGRPAFISLEEELDHPIGCAPRDKAVHALPVSKPDGKLRHLVGELRGYQPVIFSTENFAAPPLTRDEEAGDGSHKEAGNSKGSDTTGNAEHLSVPGIVRPRNDNEEDMRRPAVAEESKDQNECTTSLRASERTPEAVIDHRQGQDLSRGEIKTGQDEVGSAPKKKKHPRVDSPLGTSALQVGSLKSIQTSLARREGSIATRAIESAHELVRTSNESSPATMSEVARLRSENVDLKAQVSLLESRMEEHADRLEILEKIISGEIL